MSVEGRPRGIINLGGETLNGETKPIIATATKLNKIAELSSKNPMMELKCLMPHINKESLAGCFRALDGQKAVGIDGITKEMYGKNLEVNIDKLLDKMKSMSYRPQAAREVLIPKDGQPGETRPLAISAFEDKLVQLQVAKILEAIYEPIFKSCSYGFRPGRSCHTAIKDLFSYLNSKVCEIVIDVDLKNFFGMINHEMLLNFLRLKIKDERFIRYVARILKSGIFKESGFIISDQGAGQGSNCSPILSNIYAHYVLDVWLEEVVPNHITGEIKSFRYADDQVICCSNKNDAIKVLEALKGRLSKFGLQLNDKKTKSIEFDKRRFPRTKPGTFDYLGFTFYIRRSRKGPTHVAVKTSKVRLCSKLRNVKHWCKTSRSKCKLRPLWDQFRTKLRGHIQYYGVSLNLDGVTEFVHQATHTFFKWINRRSQRKSMSWEQFNMFLKAFPAPAVKICHHLF
jgi:group II intron reverse transcriptase/maturase